MPITTRKKVSKVNSNINVTPMVDVMLVLLIIFMVITPMLRPGPPVELARTNNPIPMVDADKENALLIAINRDGKVFLGNDQINPSDLTQKLRDGIANRNDKRVFVKADARSRYKTVVSVVDDIRAADVSELGLLTEQKRQ